MDWQPVDETRPAQPAQQRSEGDVQNVNVNVDGARATATSGSAVLLSLAQETITLQRRAAWLGQGDGAGAKPYVSFHSLFLAFFASTDPVSEWARSKQEATGLELARVLASWQRSAPEVTGLDQARLARADQLEAAELPLLADAQVSPSAQTMLVRASELKTKLGEAGAVTPLHLLAAYVYTPPEEHRQDLSAWGLGHGARGLGQPAFAARLLCFAAEQEPARADAWQGLHDEHVPRKPSANLIGALDWATLRASAAGAQAVNSRHLLEGILLAGLRDSEHKSSAALLLSQLGGPSEKLDERLPGDLISTPAAPSGGVAPMPMSPEVAAILRRAQVFATATDLATLDPYGRAPQLAPLPETPQVQETPKLPAPDGSRELCTRHVIAALLTDRGDLPAFELLRQAGRTQRGLLAQFRRWLATSSPEHDDRATWKRLFDEHRVELLAGYHNDETHGEDRLNITADVNALASVLASTKVTPPLSVGLFGDWGSGKSFFMRKLRERIETLHRAAKAQPQGQSWFCGRQGAVVQIEFNAWHYMDADLWSSLAVRVFDALNEELSTSDQRRFARACLTNLTSLQEREAQLTDEQRRLQAQQATLEQALAAEQAKRQSREVTLRTYATELSKAVVQKLRAAPDVKQLTDQLGIPLGVMQAQASLVQADVEAVLRAAPQWWRQFTSGPRLMALLGVFAAAVLVTWGVKAAVAYRAEILGVLGAINLVYAAGYAKFRAVVTRWTGNVHSAVQQVQAIEQAERAKQSEQELQLELERAQHAARIAELEREQLALARRRAELEAELARLQGGDARTLRQLILERASADDYRKNLGVISAIHRDFRELAQLLDPKQRARRSAQREAAAQGSAGPDAAPGAAPAFEVERIVLYIDDLDRCPPKRVVEVLQAIHIILSLPLFVVVVAVDSRWLLDSLTKFYREQFPVEFAPAEAARPQQYLEKIFQVPYTLWPMSDPGYANLVGAMLQAPTSAPAAETTPGAKPGAARGAVPGAKTGAAPSAAAALDASAAPAPRGPAQDHDESSRWSELTGDARASRGEPVDLTPHSLELEPAELEHLRGKLLSDLLPSPRAAKRLVNLYRIVRASLDDDELTQLISGWYRHVQVCLAVVLGNPVLATELFEQVLRNKDLQQLKPWLTERLAPTRPETRRPSSRDRVALHAVTNALADPLVAKEPDRFRDTVRRVARFSFETGRLLNMFPEDD